MVCPMLKTTITASTRRIAAAAVAVAIVPVGLFTSAHAVLGGIWYR